MSLALTFTSNFRLLAVVKQAVSALSLALTSSLTLAAVLMSTASFGLAGGESDVSSYDFTSDTSDSS